jgi:hypothetical protein
MSPDGRWILYLAWTKTQGGNPSGEGRLMRVAVAARTTQTMFPIAGYTGEAGAEEASKRPVPSAEGDPRFRCPSVPHSSCVLSESEPDGLHRIRSAPRQEG